MHQRMPVMLYEAGYEAWLGNASPEQAVRVLAPFPDDEREAYPVSRLVNTPAEDTPPLHAR